MAKKYCRTEENKYKDYKKKAEKMNRLFTITLEDAKYLFNDKCYYCGDKYNDNAYDEYSINKFKLNGIDRPPARVHPLCRRGCAALLRRVGAGRPLRDHGAAGPMGAACDCGELIASCEWFARRRAP